MKMFLTKQQNVDVKRSKINEVYMHMEGINFMDSLIGRYKIIMRTKILVHNNILLLIGYEFMTKVQKNHR